MFWDTDEKNVVINNSNTGESIFTKNDNHLLWTIFVIIILAIIVRVLYVLFLRKVNNMINTQIARQHV